MLVRDALALVGQRQQRLHRLHRQHHILRFAGNHELSAPVHHLYLKFRLQQADVLIEGAKQVDGLLHPFNADALFHSWVFASLYPVYFRYRRYSVPSVDSGDDTPICSSHSARSVTTSHFPCRAASKLCRSS